MSTTTYKTMDVSDLGDNATDADLRAFADACRREQKPDETDEQVTDRLWGNGDWGASLDPTSWRITYVEGDGVTPEVVRDGMTNDEAYAWMQARAAKAGQPITYSDGYMLNESAESGCGYWYMEKA